VLVFGKGKMIPISLYYRNKLLQEVTSSKYLGILFSSNGTFTVCQEDLYKRAIRAYFKLSRYFVDVKCTGRIKTF
jgi:hypothetical protein